MLQLREEDKLRDCPKKIDANRISMSFKSWHIIFNLLLNQVKRAVAVAVFLDQKKNSPKSPVVFDRRFQSDCKALRAVLSNDGSPKSLPKIPNSSSKVPAPAVHVSLEQSEVTPCLRFT